MLPDNGRISTIKELNDLIDARPNGGCRVADAYLSNRFGKKACSSCLECPFEACKGNEYDLFRNPKRELCHA
ncbi:MAG: hypothetical protein A9183_06910 [Dehalococcoides mccartyi]|uniref:hypothetical protein n=1 Tax=Dehalococcoides mccartyi TaxID=61435 RepID=UPI0008056D79|nr:hypothetical protein [Dehalococcoides mccartyi]OBW62616.1 MAG: hypothetical protein A9183_06910 [Dehalococcoides mccartyi]